MTLVPENINEAIKHLSGRSEEEIRANVQKILDEAGYTRAIKQKLSDSIRIELKKNKETMRTNIQHGKPVEFLTNMLEYIRYYVDRDFKIFSRDDISLIDYISYDLKRLIEKYNLNK